jgi:hypothetical protein
MLTFVRTNPERASQRETHRLVRSDRHDEASLALRTLGAIHMRGRKQVYYKLWHWSVSGIHLRRELDGLAARERDEPGLDDETLPKRSPSPRTPALKPVAIYGRNHRISSILSGMHKTHLDPPTPQR